jgi:erythromycin esterase-like protein
MTIDEWIAREAIAFSLESTESLHAAVDSVMRAVGDSAQVLGFGEPLHGGEEFLVLRNRLFQRLVEAYGFTAIAVESSFPRGRIADDYVSGRSGESYDDVRDVGFSHEFGKLEANRELIEWMREYNRSPTGGVPLAFYGFDAPTEMMYSDSPRELIRVAVDYLAAMDGERGEEFRARVELLIGNDAEWENTAANFDATKSIGLSPNATALRIAVEDLICELRTRRPELVAASDAEAFLEAVHCASAARHLLNYHAGVAGTSPRRIAELLGVRDLMMADNLAYTVGRERGRVLVFAHNSHLKVGPAEWQLGSQLLTWWPAGAHLREVYGSRYVVIGTGLGQSEENSIGAPEAGTLEARLTRAPGPGRFVATHRGEGLSAGEIAALPPRSGSAKNPGYFPLTAKSLCEYDWLAVLDSASYSRGQHPLG